MHFKYFHCIFRPHPTPIPKNNNMLAAFVENICACTKTFLVRQRTSTYDDECRRTVANIKRLRNDAWANIAECNLVLVR